MPMGALISLCMERTESHRMDLHRMKLYQSIIQDIRYTKPTKKNTILYGDSSYIWDSTTSIFAKPRFPGEYQREIFEPLPHNLPNNSSISISNMARYIFFPSRTSLLVDLCLEMISTATADSHFQRFPIQWSIFKILD